MTSETKASGAPTRHAMPFTRLEIVVFGLAKDGLRVLLGRRAEPPDSGRWALPGGVLRIDLDDSLEAAARRVMNERIGIDLPFLRQLAAVGGPLRDARAPWALSVVYRAVVPIESVAPQPGKRLQALDWREAGDAAADAGLAFDHASLVDRALQATRAEVQALNLPFEALPAEFTLGELQAACERLLGRSLDKSSFRRRLAERALVEPVPGAFRGGAFRPAQLYRRCTA